MPNHRYPFRTVDIQDEYNSCKIHRIGFVACRILYKQLLVTGNAPTPIDPCRNNRSVDLKGHHYLVSSRNLRNTDGWVDITDDDPTQPRHGYYKCAVDAIAIGAACEAQYITSEV